MADAGLENIFIAYPLVAEAKIRRALALSLRIETLIVGVDSVEGARRLSAAAGEGAGGSPRKGAIGDTGLVRVTGRRAGPVTTTKEESCGRQ